MVGDRSQVISRIQMGLVRAGVPPIDIAIMDAFCRSDELTRAAEKFARAHVESKLEPKFTEIERLELNFEYAPPLDQLLPRAGQRRAGWGYLGRMPPYDGKVLAVVGAFNKAMDWFEMVEFFRNHPDLALRAGTAVRDAYLLKRPDYDGKGEIFFPGEHSLWKDLHETREGDNRHYPCLWHDNGKVGIGGMTWVKAKVSAGRRIVCLARQ